MFMCDFFLFFLHILYHISSFSFFFFEGTRVCWTVNNIPLHSIKWWSIYERKCDGNRKRDIDRKTEKEREICVFACISNLTVTRMYQVLFKEWASLVPLKSFPLSSLKKTTAPERKSEQKLQQTKKKFLDK